MSSKQSDPIVPVQQRECTDCSCCLLFLILVVAILGIGVYAWTAGNFQKLTTAYDPDGKGCGTDYPNYPYIYFASPHSDSLWVTVCVSKCPVAGDAVLLCQPNSVVLACTPIANTGDDTKAVEIYDSSLTANTLCLPTSSTLRSQIASAVGGSTAAMTSLMNNYTLVLFGIPIAIVIAFIFMILIRLLASFFIYILILVTIAALVALGIYLLLAPSNPVTGSTGSTGTVIAAIVCFLLAFLILLLICCFRHRIALATSIIKVAANFVSGNCLLVLLPIVLFVITLLFLALWVFQALGFYSLGTPVTSQHQYPFQHFQITTPIYVLFGFHILYLIWTLMFLIETSSFIIGGTAVSWYFNRQSPYTQASERYRKKHIGSVVFAGLMMALLGLLRLIYDALVPKQSDVSQPSFLNRCCGCFCCICAQIFNWFTSGAFTVINIKGTNFCASGSEAFKLTISNIATSSIVGIVQIIFTLLVRLGITFLTVLVVYLLIENVQSYKSSVQDSSIILIVVGFVSFTISCFFISVYSDAIDSIYMTYIVDKERGTDQWECPQELREFLLEIEK